MFDANGIADSMALFHMELKIKVLKDLLNDGDLTVERFEELENKYKSEYIEAKRLINKRSIEINKTNTGEIK